MEKQSFWIIKPFNACFITVFACFLLLLIVSSLILRKKSEKLRTIVLVAACTVTFIGFFVYKYYLSIDHDYDLIRGEFGGFNWWGELPLHLCNINMILIPIAVLKKSRPMMCFGFFMAPLGAMLALVMPGIGFGGYSLLLPRNIGYYGTHFMIVMEGLAVVTYGFLSPRLKDIPLTILTAFLVTLAVFGINMLFRATGLYPDANYFFSVVTEGNPILDIFHKLIPVPFLFLLPVMVIMGIYMLIITIPFELAARAKEQKN